MTKNLKREGKERRFKECFSANFKKSYLFNYFGLVREYFPKEIYSLHNLTGTDCISKQQR